jgi:predicted HTH domain antitoxin
MMQIAIALPDEVAQNLTAKWGDLERQILEIVVVQAYRDQIISAGKVRELLGMATRLEADAFLQQKGVMLPYDIADLEADRKTHEELKQAGKLASI